MVVVVVVMFQHHNNNNMAPAPSEEPARAIGGRRQWNRRHLLDELHQIRNPKFDSRNHGVAVERSRIFLAKTRQNKKSPRRNSIDVPPK